MKTKTILPKWFNGQVYEIGDEVTNPFSGEKYNLNAEELSMYDFIMGCQMVIEMKGGPFSSETIKLQGQLRKALDWFRKFNAKAYMVLLD